MEAWIIILYMDAKTITFDMQNEDACINAAKQLTERALHKRATCVNQNDGRVIFFKDGVVIE